MRRAGSRVPATAGGLALLLLTTLLGAVARRRSAGASVQYVHQPLADTDHRSHQPAGAVPGPAPADPSRAPGWWGVPAAAAGAALLFVAGVIGAVSMRGPGGGVGDLAGDGGPNAAASLPALPAPPRVPPPAPEAAAPVWVEIPVIAVGADIDPLGLRPNGELDVPTRFERVGWWAGGVAPGDRGPAVLAGHVDSRRAPAVFFRLRELNAGDEVRVRGADGTTVLYTVERSGNYAKTDFPTAEVYGPTERPTLRLVTCSGRFDRSRRSYEENLVVYATAKV